MRDKQAGLVIQTFREVVRKQVFMLAEPIDKSLLPAPGEDFRCARVAITGDLSGAVSLVVPSELCREIAANMLGVVSKEHLASFRAEDSFLELANVFTGHLRGALVGQGARVRAMLPELSTMDLAEWRAYLASPDCQGFLVDETPVLVKVTTEALAP
ncbi:MAG: hypothetical protein HUU16_07545 [Candidatus Omnitrophica bacterium]|nr:hypothetical protein [Candidatus Omnitrophota bacterium]